MKKTYAFLSALAFTTAGYAAAPAEAPGLKFTGFLQYRYEWIKNPEALAEDTMTIDTNHDGSPIPATSPTPPPRAMRASMARARPRPCSG